MYAEHSVANAPLDNILIFNEVSLVTLFQPLSQTPIHPYTRHPDSQTPRHAGRYGTRVVGGGYRGWVGGTRAGVPGCTRAVPSPA